MANLFLPQIITWFRLDEHVKRLKSILDSLIDRVTVLEETPVPVFTSPYKVYTALLTQTGTNAPVATILENTLGYTPVFYYNTIGSYAVFLDGEEMDKIFLPVSYYSRGNSHYRAYVEDIGLVTIQTFSDLTSTTESVSNDILEGFYQIEIRVYN